VRPPSLTPPSAARRGLLLLALLATACAGAEVLPFATHDQSPFAAIHGLPDSGNLPGPGVDLVLDVSNTLNQQRRGGEVLFLDGESYRAGLRAGFRLGAGWRLQATVPLVAHSGGRLDGFIHDFHHAFGFPDGGRDQQPEEELLYSYQRDGQPEFTLSDAEQGLGDIRLAIGHPLGVGDTLGWAQLKVPSGEPRRLTGSGAAELALWLTGQRRLAAQWAGYGGGGLLLMQRGEVLESLQRDHAWFGDLGVQWRLTERFALQVELSAHSALYDSDLPMLGSAAQIASGGWLRFAGGSCLQLAVIEDIDVGTAPDVTFHAAWRGAC